MGLLKPTQPLANSATSGVPAPHGGRSLLEPAQPYRVQRCPTCQRRRRVQRHDPIRVEGRRYWQWRCSKGHQWLVEIGSLERVNEVSQNTLLPLIAQQFQPGGSVLPRDEEALMGLLSSAVKAPFLWKRALAELRLLRRATERLADAAELLAQQASPASRSSFRGLSHEKVPEDGKGSEISYIVDADLIQFLERESELSALLGRQPTTEEVDRALRGDIE